MLKQNWWSYLYLFGWAFAVIAGSLWFSDPDIFWHLKVGEWIVENNAVPRTDVYSWTVYGEPWTAHQWFWEVVLYSVHKYLGYLGIWALTLVMGFIAGAFIRGGLKFKGVSEGVATAAGGLAVLLLIGWLKPWPQAGVYALFGAYLYFSLRNRWGPGEVLYAAGIGLVWANIHSTAVMLPLLLMAEVFWKLIFDRNNMQDIWWRLAAVCSSGIATLITPHGFGLWRYAVGQGLLTSIYRDHVMSWQPYQFGFNALSLIFFISIFILFVAVRQGKEKDLEFIRAAGFWVLALMSRIYSPFAILSTAVLFGLLKIELGTDSIKRMAVISILVGLVMLPLQGIPSDLVQVAREDSYPVDALEHIKEEGYEKIYNDHGWGGYMLWNDVPVYVDGRNDLYGGIFEKNIEMWRSEKPIGETLEETGAETVLTSTHSVMDLTLRGSRWWMEVYRDEVAVIYVKIK